ncbi:biotin-dependent carboxyltransferase family protein [Alkalihalobacillus sp. AL-G]|uniref:5-oxoprolinase subunit C family protein n=1 Tax=Alkalihalobacillus sp. AL-G TaxID=2926399 RepID=UPI00272D4482|nr:biotin-dependent carboxyltransferase family protein [Alkalihalobacillus sp. AL-G]WLD94210.1 biotin-dependent carboxyltransferase family protein [Alkalihalobacillus sp. AL-G]
MITIVQPGLFTTIQDKGRVGFQKFGVPVSGAMDIDAHRIANLLVGNDENSATIEMTIQGTEMKLEQDALVAFFGRGPTLRTNSRELPHGRPHFLSKGSIVKHAFTGSGARSYMAVAGGINVPIIMDSRSTYTRASFGGHEGRRLAKGDQLEIGKLTTEQEKILQFIKETGTDHLVTWFVPSQFFDSDVPNNTIQIIKNEQLETFTIESQNALLARPFTVTSQSDRMGYRLEGAELSKKSSKNEISSAVPFGTIQVPPDGNPIILLADRQTTGGYPIIGYTASIDRHKLAQMKPGDKLYFESIDVEEAQEQFFLKEEAIRQVKAGIKLRLKGLKKK